MTIECDCGAVVELPEGFFESTAYTFWAHHGHFPAKVTYRCVCGATQASGRLTGQDPESANARDTAWYLKHLAHETK